MADKHQHLPFCFLSLGTVWSVISCTSSFFCPAGLFSNYTIFTLLCQIVCQLAVLNMSLTAILPHTHTTYLPLFSCCFLLTVLQSHPFPVSCSNVFICPPYTHVAKPLIYFQFKDPFVSFPNSTYS